MCSQRQFWSCFSPLNLFCCFASQETLKVTSVVQIAGVSAPLLCHLGGAELCVSASCQRLQEGEFFISSLALICDVIFPPILLTISSVPQVILSTNIAESSVTVPDVKYGGSFCRFRSVFKSSFMLILCFCFCFLAQWSTSAWCVAWFVTKTPISSFCLSNGHRKPAVTSVEVQCLFLSLLKTIYILINTFKMCLFPTIKKKFRVQSSMELMPSLPV